MKRANRTNALVVELMMAVLFFMLASTVLAQVFGHARVVSNRAEVLTRALAAAQNTADRLYAAGDPEQTLSEEGFTQSEEGLWEKEEEERGSTPRPGWGNDSPRTPSTSEFSCPCSVQELTLVQGKEPYAGRRQSGKKRSLRVSGSF